MAHTSENQRRLAVEWISASSVESLVDEVRAFDGVCVLRLPSRSRKEPKTHLENIDSIASTVAENLGKNATLVVLGETPDLVHIHSAIATSTQYQLWIAIKGNQNFTFGAKISLPEHHFGALVHTRYTTSLKHTKTRQKYTYCPVCNKTTKDYGGKTHKYHEHGTLISDVWRDMDCDLGGDITPVVDRLADFFGIEDYDMIRTIDCRNLGLKRTTAKRSPQCKVYTEATLTETRNTIGKSRLIQGDCLQELKKLPDNSVDFAFADPPYNLNKKYTGYEDDLTIAKYFEWCDEWLVELIRVLREGRTCSILNIPLWAIRHYLKLEDIATFQDWIVWDALSFPVRRIMPAHYTVLSFTKGESRELPGLTKSSKREIKLHSTVESESFSSLEPLDEGFCIRRKCINKRTNTGVEDRGLLTNLWWDIHRLRHNTRRVDHPCQLPPRLMYRLISIYTEPGEMVLDCFNGAGTTTLAAQQLGRDYLGIELARDYHKIAQARHQELSDGLDPFRIETRVLTSKNSQVPRLKKQKYEVPKKTLQLEVKRVAIELGRLPNRSELSIHGSYPIKYYDDYFAGWGEVCAAARTTGMSEDLSDSMEMSERYAPSPFDARSSSRSARR